MILATGCEPIAPPTNTGDPSEFEIDTRTPCFEGAKAELQADEWVCVHTAAFPHVDDQRHFGCRFFLTLSCVTGWTYGEGGDASKRWSPGLQVDAGRLFVVDLEQVHWLSPLDPGLVFVERPSVWWGLQWRCRDLRALKRTARRVVDQLGGTWLESSDRRYRKVRP